MALFPLQPVPASVSVADMIDPVHEFRSDFGYRQTRSRYPRQLRAFQLQYLGLTTSELRYLRAFIAQHRLSATPFEFWTNVFDKMRFDPTTPITIVGYHTFVTGQYVLVSDATAPGVTGLWQIVVYNEIVFALVGTTSPGVSGECNVRMYLPKARVRTTEEGVFAGVEKLIGPESTNSSPIGMVYIETRGRFNMEITIEELF